MFNYDVPNIAETYVHRIGRTARAGATGVALSFCDHEERGDLRSIEKLLRKSIVVKTDHPEYPAGEGLPPGNSQSNERFARGSGPGDHWSANAIEAAPAAEGQFSGGGRREHAAKHPRGNRFRRHESNRGGSNGRSRGRRRSRRRSRVS